MSGVLRTCTVDELAEFKLRVGYKKGKKTLWFRYAYDGKVYEIPNCMTTNVPRSWEAVFENGYYFPELEKPTPPSPPRPKPETFGPQTWNFEENAVPIDEPEPQAPAPPPAYQPIPGWQLGPITYSWEKKWHGDRDLGAC